VATAKPFATPAFDDRSHDGFVQPGATDAVKERDFDQISSEMTSLLVFDPRQLNSLLLGYTFKTWPCASRLPIANPIQTTILNLIS